MSAAFEPTRMQQLILAGQRLLPESPLYNMAFSFEIEGPLDAPRLEAAVRSVIAENECLRLYLDSDDRPRIAEPERFGLRLAAGPVGAALLEAEVAKPMDLHAGCFESTLYHCGDHRYVWYVKKHHLITDGVAFVEFFRQVESAYRGDALRVVPFAEQLRRETRLTSATSLRRARGLLGRTLRQGRHHGGSSAPWPQRNGSTLDRTQPRPE